MRKLKQSTGKNSRLPNLLAIDVPNLSIAGKCTRERATGTVAERSCASEPQNSQRFFVAKEQEQKHVICKSLRNAHE